MTSHMLFLVLGGVLAEIGIFFATNKLLERYPARVLLMTSLALTTGRWLLIGAFVQSQQLATRFFSRQSRAGQTESVELIAEDVEHRVGGERRVWR